MADELPKPGANRQGRGGGCVGGRELPHKSDEGARRTNQDQYLPKISTKLELIQF